MLLCCCTKGGGGGGGGCTCALTATDPVTVQNNGGGAFVIGLDRQKSQPVLNSLSDALTILNTGPGAFTFNIDTSRLTPNLQGTAPITLDSASTPGTTKIGIDPNRFVSKVSSNSDAITVTPAGGVGQVTLNVDRAKLTPALEGVAPISLDSASKPGTTKIALDSTKYVAKVTSTSDAITVSPPSGTGEVTLTVDRTKLTPALAAVAPITLDTTSTPGTTKIGIDATQNVTTVTSGNDALTVNPASGVGQVTLTVDKSKLKTPIASLSDALNITPNAATGGWDLNIDKTKIGPTAAALCDSVRTCVTRPNDQIAKDASGNLVVKSQCIATFRYVGGTNPGTPRAIDIRAEAFNAGDIEVVGPNNVVSCTISPGQRNIQCLAWDPEFFADSNFTIRPKGWPGPSGAFSCNDHYDPDQPQYWHPVCAGTDAANLAAVTPALYNRLGPGLKRNADGKIAVDPPAVAGTGLKAEGTKLVLDQDSLLTGPQTVPPTPLKTLRDNVTRNAMHGSFYSSGSWQPKLMDAWDSSTITRIPVQTAEYGQGLSVANGLIKPLEQGQMWEVTAYVYLTSTEAVTVWGRIEGLRPTPAATVPATDTGHLFLPAASTADTARVLVITDLGPTPALDAANAGFGTVALRADKPVANSGAAVYVRWIVKRLGPQHVN